jgi:thiol-disulfide isomerase/thioredoxin
MVKGCVMKQMLRLFLLLGLLLSHQVDAKPLKPFVGASRLAIEKAYQGQPLILAFWSLDCNYCLDELTTLGELVKQHPKVHLVLVNTDGLSTSQEVVNALKKIRLPVAYDAWQFSEPDEERLRYSVDKAWYGELPRTYYYDRSHQVKAISGSPDLLWLKSWASQF